MEEYLLSHILDLARQSKRKGKTFFSDFLGVSEQGSLANILQGETIEGTHSFPSAAIKKRRGR